MNGSAPLPPATSTEDIPDELLALFERVRLLPREIRSELEPILMEALDDARFRGKVLLVAKEALERLKLDLELTKFDLDATRREREDLKRRLGPRVG